MARGGACNKVNMERRLLDLVRRAGGDSSSEDEEEVPLLDSEGQSSSSNESGVESRENTVQSEDTSSPLSRLLGGKKKTEFDISLPARHLYLGELEEDGPANMEDVETTPTLPLLCIPSRILFPGETLPMHIFNPHVVQMLRDASTRGKPVAISTDLRVRHHTHQERPTQEELAQIGTTAEVVGFKEDEVVFYGSCFIVKFLGRQRFRLLDLHKRVNGLMDCRVKILPEQYLPPPPVHLSSCPAHIFASCHATQLMARQPDCTVRTQMQLEQCRKRLQSPHLSSTLVPAPSWVFTQYNFDNLREELMMEEELKTFENSAKSAILPSDISSLSYWLARRLPIDEHKKLHLLTIDCPTLRLIRGLQILKEFTELSCVHCQAPIAKKCHMFSMSVDGPLAAYVNPGGYVHDTLTVTEAKGVKRRGPSSTEHSWFPGYKWTILNCRGCDNHKGWCFEATKKNLLPAKFYGLTRAGLVLTSAKQVQGVPS